MKMCLRGKTFLLIISSNVYKFDEAFGRPVLARHDRAFENSNAFRKSSDHYKEHGTI